MLYFAAKIVFHKTFKLKKSILSIIFILKRVKQKKFAMNINEDDIIFIT